MYSLQAGPTAPKTPMAAAPPIASASPWRWFLISGGCLMAVGVGAILLPLATALAVEVWLGVLMLFAI